MIKLRLYLYSFLAILLLISIYLWRCTSNSDLGGNLFTEILGIIITVFVIDKILQKINEDKQRSLTASAYVEIRQITNRYISFIKYLFSHSVEEPMPKSIEELLSSESILKIWKNVDVTKQDIHLRLEEIGKRTFIDGSKTLDRHGWHIEPLIYRHIHNITESMFIVKLHLGHFKSQYEDTLKNNPDMPKVLNCYFIPPKKFELESLLELHYWCKNKYDKLHKEFKLLKYWEWTAEINSERSLTLRRDPHILSEELRIYEEKFTRRKPWDLFSSSHFVQA